MHHVIKWQLLWVNQSENTDYFVLRALCTVWSVAWGLINIVFRDFRFRKKVATSIGVTDWIVRN